MEMTERFNMSNIIFHLVVDWYYAKQKTPAYSEGIIYINLTPKLN